MSTFLLLVSVLGSPVPAAAQQQAGGAATTITSGGSGERLYCGRLPLHGRWQPETSTCKSLAEWRSMINQAERRKRETQEVININPGQR